MADTTQISAHIPVSLKERMERYSRANGVTRAHIIEQALSAHLEALDALPLDAIVPTRLVLDEDSAKRVLEVNTRPPRPTKAMKRLFDES